MESGSIGICVLNSGSLTRDGLSTCTSPIPLTVSGDFRPEGNRKSRPADIAGRSRRIGFV